MSYGEYSIGGEPFYPLSLLTRNPKSNIKKFFLERFPNHIHTYTYGGYYSIKRIIEDIQFDEQDSILLPSYLCPTILIPFKEYGIKYQFYKVDKKLTIDIDDLYQRINTHTKAIFIINYFGFSQSQEIRTAINNLKVKGIVIIQDLVQCFYATESVFIGNYGFNSFRKFFPAEGSVIFSDHKLKKVSLCSNEDYFEEKLLGRIERYRYYSGQNPEEESFLKAFSNAHDCYRSHNHVDFCLYDEFVLNRIDLISESALRKSNFKILLEIFRTQALYKDFFEDTTPLAFPIILPNRDSLRKQLQNIHVYCPIHWILSNEIDQQTFCESWQLSQNILSIPLNFRMQEFRPLLKIINL